MPENPIKFPVGSVIRSVYTNKVFVVLKHTKQGLTYLRWVESLFSETWNSYNNAHFVFADNVPLAVLICI